MATGNQLAELPVPGLEPRSVVGVINYSTAEDYLSSSTIVDLPTRREAMTRDGFRGGTNVAYRSGPDNYGAVVLRFADSNAAVDYLGVHLSALCSSAAMVRPIAGLTGVSYLRTDNLAKAAFVVGDTEVQLDICTCVEVRDRTALAARWAVAVADQLTADR